MSHFEIWRGKCWLLWHGHHMSLTLTSPKKGYSRGKQYNCQVFSFPHGASTAVKQITSLVAHGNSVKIRTVIIIIILSSLVSFANFLFPSEKCPTFANVTILLHFTALLSLEGHLVLSKRSLITAPVQDQVSWTKNAYGLFWIWPNFKDLLTWTKGPMDVLDMTKCLLTLLKMPLINEPF